MAHLVDNTKVNSFKVGLCGAQGTGKTSIAVALAERTSLEFVPSPARRIGALFGHSQYASPIGQALISQDVFNNISQEGRFVFDRTPIDVQAYTNYALNDWDIRFSMNDREIDEYAGVMREFTINAMRQLDAVFFVPVAFEVVDDQFRDTSKEYQRQISDEMRMLLVEYGISHFTVPEGSVEERVSFILSAAPWYNYFQT